MVEHDHGTGEPGHQHGHYTHGLGGAALASHAQRTAQNSAAHLLEHLRPGLDLLDIGCGPGTITLDLAELVAPGRVVGLDSGQAALDAAADEAERRRGARPEWIAGDALDLPFEDDSFDVVHAHQVLHHLPDPVRAIREMVRVARPGGVVSCREADYSAMAWFPEFEGISAWRDTYRTFSGSNGAQPDAGRRLRSWGNAAGLTALPR